MPIITLETCPDLESRSFLLRAGDLRARFILLALAEKAYERACAKQPKDKALYRAAAVLMHAMDYLHDRMAYELEPPPNSMAIRYPFDPTEAKAELANL